jgi:hypothetical protein
MEAWLGGPQGGPVRVLIACEFSGVVRDAFRSRGHDAVSCDLLDTSTPGPHIRGDVLDILAGEWDMMISFPPCTHLAVSGAKWFAAKRADGRQQAGVDFFMALARAPIPRIAIENPVGIMSSVWRKPDQIVQPWHFGDDASKATCLWLKNLPPLLSMSGSRLAGDRSTRRANQTPSGQNKLGPSPDRWKLRSATFPGIAAAMALQWDDDVEIMPEGSAP